MKKFLLYFFIVAVVLFTGYYLVQKVNLNPNYEVGQKIDEFNGVAVYYNGGVGNVEERNLTDDGYNLGLKYQCVEFVKRYYFEHLNHKMPDTFGHAKDFFDTSLKDGQRNQQRDLIQYINSGNSRPEVNDLVVYSPTITNRYGHVAIISSVNDDEVEIIQQNPGPFGDSRETYSLIVIEKQWKIDNDRIMGWLRKE